MVFGRGDHVLDHLSHALYTFPFFLGVGERRIRPLAVEDLVDVLVAALVDGRLAGKTVGLVGPTEIGFDDAARLVARMLGVRRPFVRMPLAFHYGLARAAQALMTFPLISVAQVRILREEVIEAVNAPDQVPSDLVPATPFDETTVRAGLPPAGRFTLEDLRFRGRRLHVCDPDFRRGLRVLHDLRVLGAAGIPPRGTSGALAVARRRGTGAVRSQRAGRKGSGLVGR
jgi:NADH dehydrogenase